MFEDKIKNWNPSVGKYIVLGYKIELKFKHECECSWIKLWTRYLGTERKRPTDGTAWTRKCHGPCWEAGCPCLGTARSLRQWLPEPFLLSLSWEKRSLPLFHWESAAAMRVYHIYHTVLKWPITCKNDLRPRGKRRAAAACLCAGRLGTAY